MNDAARRTGAFTANRMLSNSPRPSTRDNNFTYGCTNARFTVRCFGEHPLAKRKKKFGLCRKIFFYRFEGLNEYVMGQRRQLIGLVGHLENIPFDCRRSPRVQSCGVSRYY